MAKEKSNSVLLNRYKLSMKMLIILGERWVNLRWCAVCTSLMKLPFSTLPEGEKTERALCIKIGTRACRKEKTRSSEDDQTIILGLQIFLDHRSLISIDHKMLMTQIFVVSVSVQLYKCIFLFYLSGFIYLMFEC